MTDFQQLERLRAELRRPGRSQSDLARHLGLHPSAVNKILAGRRDIKVREMAAIEDYLRATSADIDDLIRRAENASPKQAAASEANIGLGSTHYPGPFIAADVDLARLHTKLGSLVELALDNDDPIKLVLECWRILSENIKSYICERLRSLNEADYRYLITSDAMDDIVLLRALAVTFNAFNEDEMSRIASLRELVDLLRSDKPSDGTGSVSRRVERCLNHYAPLEPDSDTKSLTGRILVTTLKYSNLVLQARARYIQQIQLDASAVRRRRGKAQVIAQK